MYEALTVETPEAAPLVETALTEEITDPQTSDATRAGTASVTCDGQLKALFLKAEAHVGIVSPHFSGGLMETEQW